MYNIVDAESNFVSNGFKLAQDELSKKAKMQMRAGGGGGGGGGQVCAFSLFRSLNNDHDDVV